MKLIDFYETILTGAVPPQVIDGIYEELEQNATHIGDQDRCRVVYKKYNDNHLYGIDCGTGLAAFATFTDVVVAGQSMYQLQLVDSKRHDFYTIARLLWFVKDQQQKPIIDYGAQSRDGNRFVQALNKSNRFHLSWMNTKTGEKQEYNPTDNSKYSHTERTDWRVLIEKSDAPSFPRYQGKFDWWILFEEEAI